MFALTPIKIISAVVIAGAFASTTAIGSSIPLPEVTCETEISKSGRMVTLHSMIEANFKDTGPYTGRYNLTIKKSTGGSSMNISQGGDFELKGGETITVGMSNMSGRVKDFNVDFDIYLDNADGKPTKYSCYQYED